ncbi:MAG: hypothetical protein Q7V58_09535 [Actinomycetota bacterium]|nr:hypothetical protein [Actinomycetota bacterium]
MTPRPGKALCQAHHDQPREAAPGLAVCTWHRGKALECLSQLPVIHDVLEGYMPVSTGPSSGMVTTSRDPGLRTNTAAANARRDIRNCLASWVSWATQIVADTTDPRTGARSITRRLDVTPPPTPRTTTVTATFLSKRTPSHPQEQQVKVTRTDLNPAVPGLDLHALAGWLARYVDWFLASERAAGFADDVLDTARRARSVRQCNHVSTFEIRPCPEPDCDGTLIATVRSADDRLPSVILCDKSPLDPDTGAQLHIWPAGEGWHNLGRKIHKRQIQ